MVEVGRYHTYLTASSYVSRCAWRWVRNLVHSNQLTATAAARWRWALPPVSGPVVQNQLRPLPRCRQDAHVVREPSQRPQSHLLSRLRPANGSLGAIDNTPANAAIVVYTRTVVRGTDSFVFKASDGTNESSNATFMITVVHGASAPTAGNVVVTTNEDAPRSSRLLARP